MSENVSASSSNICKKLFEVKITQPPIDKYPGANRGVPSRMARVWRKKFLRPGQFFQNVYILY